LAKILPVPADTGNNRESLTPELGVAANEVLTKLSFSLIAELLSNNMENLKAPDDIWKVRLIEEDFHRLMFEREGVS